MTSDIRPIALPKQVLSACAAAAMMTCLCSCMLLPQQDKGDDADAQTQQNEPAEDTSAEKQDEPQASQQQQQQQQQQQKQQAAVDDGDFKSAAVRHATCIDDAFTGNTVCALPLQICWNMAMDSAGGPFISPTGEPAVGLLDARATSAADVRPDYYYAFAGNVNNPGAVYDEITGNLDEKFGEKSDLITPEFLSGIAGKDLFYSMLYHKFTYAEEFKPMVVDAQGTAFASGNTSLGCFGTDAHGNQSQNVAYFGLDSYQSKYSGQVEVLYHDDDANCAVMLKSEEDDNIIVVKNPQGATGREMLVNALNKALVYDGSRKLSDNERLAIPKCEFETLTNFAQLQGAYCPHADGSSTVVAAAMQKTKLRMDEKGGEVKSEAYVATENTSLPKEETEPKIPRQFIFNDTYAVFIVDGSIYSPYDLARQVPYFSMLVTDISELQEGAQRTQPVTAPAQPAPAQPAPVEQPQVTDTAQQPPAQENPVSNTSVGF